IRDLIVTGVQTCALPIWKRVHADAKRDPAKWEVKLTVKPATLAPGDHDMGKTKALDPMPWDDSWKLGEERPASLAAPMSIPQLRSEERRVGKEWRARWAT